MVNFEAICRTKKLTSNLFFLKSGTTKTKNYYRNPPLLTVKKGVNFFEEELHINAQKQVLTSESEQSLVKHLDKSFFYWLESENYRQSTELTFLTYLSSKNKSAMHRFDPQCRRFYTSTCSIYRRLSVVGFQITQRERERLVRAAIHQFGTSSVAKNYG